MNDDLKREVITYKDEAEWLQLRQRDITSTQVATLFGEGKWITLRGLWEMKRNNEAEEFQETKRTRAGKKFETNIAELICEDNGLVSAPDKVYRRIPSLRLGSSYDHAFVGGDLNGMPFEIKMVDRMFYKDWFNAAGQLEAPTYMELQFQNELLCGGFDRGAIGVCFGLNDWYLIRREYIPEIGQRIIERVGEFWEMKTPPAFDFENDKDRELVKRIYAKPTEGLKIQADAGLEGLMEAYLEIAKEVSDAAKTKEKLAADIQAVLKDAEEAQGEHYKVTWKTVNKKEYMVKASSSRQLRVTDLKGKE